MTSDMYAGHWTSIDSGMSSAAVLSSQSLAGHDPGVRDPRRLDHLAAELGLQDNENNRGDDPSLKAWLPTMQDLFSPSNSSGSGENFGLSSGGDSKKSGSKLFTAQDDLESQMLQLKLDFNSMKQQNKQLKDRCQHYQRLNDEMRLQTKTDANGFYNRLHESLIEKIVSAQRRKIDSDDDDHHHLQKRLSRLEKEKESLKEMNAALETELDVSRDGDRTDRNRSKEQTVLKEELVRLRELFEHCEKKRQTDLMKWRDELDCVTRLGKLNDWMLKELEQVEEHQFDSKRAESLEQRVKMLEESLQKERVDRATMLSAVEERLLLENAKLKVSEKEAQRHLAHTTSQFKCLEDQYKKAKILIENHNLQSEDIDAMTETSSHRHIKEDGGSKGHGALNAFHSLAENDSLQQKFTDAEAIFQQQNRQLIHEKNEAEAELKNLRDINGALKAENDLLRSSLRSSQIVGSRTDSRFLPHHDQFEVLKSELKGAVDQIAQLTEANKYADAVLQRIQDFSLTSERADTARPKETEKLRLKYNAPRSNAHENEHGSESHFRHKKQKLFDDQKKNSEYSELLLHLTRSKMAATEAEFLQTDESEPLTLEGVVEEKDQQLLKLSFECDELRTELEFAKKSRNQQAENNEKLLSQVEELRNQLKQHSRTVEVLSSAEDDLQLELRITKQRLANANRQLLEQEVELKSVRILHEVGRTGDASQSRDGAPTWNQLDANKDVDFEDRLTLTRISAQLIQIQYENQQMNDSLQKANATIEALVQENAELKHTLQQFHEHLTNERNMVCRLTYDKMAAQQQYFASDEESDALRQQKDKLEAEISRLEINALRLSALLDSYKLQTRVKVDTRFNKVSNELKRKSTELLSTKRLLSSREKDILLLQNTIELMLKHDEAASVR